MAKTTTETTRSHHQFHVHLQASIFNKLLQIESAGSHKSSPAVIDCQEAPCVQRHSNQMRKLACRQMSLVWLQGAQACKKADSKRKTKQRCAQGCGKRRASHWSLRRCAATTWLRAGEARMNWKHICGRQETCMTLCLTERPLRHATAEMETYNDIGR